MTSTIRHSLHQKALRILTATLMCTATATSFANADSFKKPDILVLGDSQITFGSGPAFLDFFQNIKQNCSPNKKQLRDLEKLGAQSVAVIGVRSTSLHSWTARSGKPKGSVCDVDPTWKVNAGSYGTVAKKNAKNVFIQIGQGKQYQFCKKGLSPFEAMFKDNYYDPKLLVLSFLGNSSGTWAKSKSAAVTDVKATIKHLPKDTPCIFMTTAPAYKKKVNDDRLRAQKNIKAAFAETGNRCTFVEGLTPQSIAANLGNKKHFRLKKSGAVKDPFHPNKRAARKFFKIEKQNICNAIFEQVALSTKS
ncbi:SGNH/GDSL hydrolase family protein [Amylibacter sp. SFDW26]|uniref:SGNH/GDSL hydrolase family protein n=1 Tax=Amylibacter sp. SFDW26 TaxID=2652722 RepID=UPI001261B967|nr:SGNH/GDSL hydrolase family protein [Amylibacter sp. SFDW26]KAB7616155.1 SGNH/GDSL hydrolase family protein [Amylibacter sp. SFDW26]